MFGFSPKYIVIDLIIGAIIDFAVEKQILEFTM
jgi:hypothetical protein